MSKDAVLRRIANLSASEVDEHLQLVPQMPADVNVLRRAEIEACRQNFNSTSLLFPEDFVDDMNELGVELEFYGKALKELDWYEEALNNQLKTLKQNT